LLGACAPRRGREALVVESGAAAVGPAAGGVSARPVSALWALGGVGADDLRHAVPRTAAVVQPHARRSRPGAQPGSDPPVPERRGDGRAGLRSLGGPHGLALRALALPPGAGGRRALP